MAKHVRIDRIDDSGNIREHITCTECIDEKGEVKPDIGVARTLCGLRLYVGRTQTAIGNRTCKRCDRIRAELGEGKLLDASKADASKEGGHGG